MRIRSMIVNRRALFSAFAAGALAGCQSTKPPFAEPGVARGGAVAASPAFAQVNAGQQLPMAMAGNRMMPMGQGMSSGMAMQPGVQPVMGSGGMVYPVGYTPHANSTMPMPTQPAMSSMAMQPTMTSMSQPMMMMQPQATMMAQPGMAMPAATNTPGQPTLLLVQGPNGPQYIIAEVLSTSPQPVAMPSPMMPSGNAVTVTTPTLADPVPPAAPPAATAPTFVAPLPALIPVVESPKPSEMSKSKLPETLPRSLSDKPPSGPVLPVSTSSTSGPSLGNFPAVPPTKASSGLSLPAGSHAIDDFIPPAPIFVPNAK